MDLLAVDVLDESPTQNQSQDTPADDHALLRRRRAFENFSRPGTLTGEDDQTPPTSRKKQDRPNRHIEHIRTAAWDLVILDLNLPDMPGLEVLRILKSVQPGLPVLVVSIYSEEHYAARAVRAGALGCLTKETGPEELRTAVSRILQGGRYIPPTPATNRARRRSPSEIPSISTHFQPDSRIRG